MARHDAPVRAALRIAGLYLLFCVAWILLSDAAVRRITDAGLAAELQTAKGLVFVLVSAGVLFWLVFRELRALQERQGREEVLLTQELVGVYVIQGGRFLWVNRELAHLFGHPPEAMTASLAVADVVAPEDRDNVLARLREREVGDVEEAHYRFTGLRRNGSRFRAEVHGRRVQWDGHGAVMGILLDVTEREAMEEQALSAQRLEALGQLTGAVAHDFNNLLTAIITPLELAIHQLEESHPARAELREALGTAETAARLTRQLLAFGRRRVHRPIPLELGGLVQGMESMLRRLAAPGVGFTVETAGRTLPVEIDPSHFQQVTVNLVVNAAEAVGAGGHIRIRTGSVERDEEGWAFLEVHDDGPGIAPEVQGRMFEPFFTTKEGGTGLGLATVHGIVTQAGGRVELESPPGRGTCFRILLPFTEATPEVDLGMAEPPARPERGGGQGILLVDDEAPVRRVTSRALRRFGYHVVEAVDAAGALERAGAESQGIELVLTDVGLPDLNGVELAARLRHLLPGVPVVFTSGHSDRTVMDRLAADRSAHFLEKPYSVEGLLLAVALALKGKAPETHSDASDA